jgi:hypothetical protein
MIDDIVIGFLGAALGKRLLQVFRPKKRSIFDSMTFDELQVRNRWIEYGGMTVTLATLILAWGLMVAVGLQHNLWRVGFMLGMPYAAMFAFVSAATLPSGIRRFREYWRFHELKQRIRLAVLLTLYVPPAVLGLVSAVYSF